MHRSYHKKFTAADYAYRLRQELLTDSFFKLSILNGILGWGGGGVHLTWVDSNTGEVNIVDHVGDDDNSSDGSDQITVI